VEENGFRDGSKRFRLGFKKGVQTRIQKRFRPGSIAFNRGSEGSERESMRSRVSVAGAALAGVLLRSVQAQRAQDQARNHAPSAAPMFAVPSLAALEPKTKEEKTRAKFF
jgi:hypothetical protein